MPRRSRKQITLTDPRAIRALSHPARVAVIDELYGGRVATSTELAELTGLTPSAMSYHLRAMERFGIVERDDSATDGRQRPWRAAGKGINVSALATPAQRAAVSLLVGSVLETQRKALEAYAAAESELLPEWREAVNADSGIGYLTAEETRELAEAMQRTVEPYRQSARRRRRNTRRVRFGFTVVPEVDRTRP